MDYQLSLFLQVTACEKCGLHGNPPQALVYCDECKVAAQHFYCVSCLPQSSKEIFVWACHACSSLDRSRNIQATQARSRKKCKEINPAYPRNLEEVPRLKSSSCLVTDKEKRKADLIEYVQLGCECSDLPDKSKNSTITEANFSGVRNIVLGDGDASSGSMSCVRNENSLKVTCSLPDILEESWHEPAQPILHPVWRGSFRISTEEFGIVNGLAAYLSSQASPRVAEAAISFPRSLHLRKFSRLEVFPRLLYKHGVQDRDIGLYFFPEKERDEQAYEKLVEDLINQDLAMKAELEHVELLLFTSPQLPVESWRYQKKYYLWGLFKRKGKHHSETS